MAKKARLISRALLARDERIIYEARPSAWRFMIGGAIALVVAIAAILIAAWQSLPFDLPDIPYLQGVLEGDYGLWMRIGLIALFVLATFYFIARWLRWSYTVYAATDERIIIQRGILGKTYDDIPLGMIANVDVIQPFRQQLLGYGTIIFSIQSPEGRRKGDMVWEAVPRPIYARRALQEVMDTRIKEAPRSKA